MAVQRRVEQKPHRFKSGFAPSNNDVVISRSIDAREKDHYVPDCPWDYPPGTPGSRHDGTWRGSEAPEGWQQRLHQVDPKLDLAYQPVSHRWVVWRYNATGSWTCVTPVENPHTNEPMELNQLFLAFLWASDPARYPRAKDAYHELKRRDERYIEKAERDFDDRFEDARRQAEFHTKIGTHGRGNKAARIDAAGS